VTEFRKTPFFTVAEFEAMGYPIVIWPGGQTSIKVDAH
jgi:methylisocitrate lyase